MKKTLKTLVAVLMVAALIAAFAVGLAACNEKGGGSGTLELYVPDGAPALAVAKLIAEKDTLTVAGYKIEVNIVPANQIGAHMAKGDGDIVIMPANAGVNLIMKGAEYKFVCLADGRRGEARRPCRQESRVHRTGRCAGIRAHDRS